MCPSGDVLILNTSSLLVLDYTAFSVNSFCRGRNLVIYGIYFGQEAIRVWNESVSLDITFSIGFILYFLIGGRRFESCAHLGLFSLHKVHVSGP